MVQGAGAINRRQDRSSPVRTLSLTKPATTRTALVTLGQPAPSDLNSATTTTTTATTEMAPAQTLAVPSRNDDLTQEQIGAIVGSIVGVVVLVLIIWWCISQPARYRRRSRRWRDDGYSSEGYSPSVRSDRVRRDSWARRERRGSRSSRMAPPPGWMPGPPPPAYNLNLNRPPTTFPPSMRQGYRQTPQPQIRGVRRYP
jgi:hypothetical protein